MRVSIEHSTTTTGMLKKKTHYVVTVTVKFSPEEMKVLNDVDLGDIGVLDRPWTSVSTPPQDGETQPLLIKFLMTGQPNAHAFTTPGDARDYAEAVEAKMPELKGLIEHNHPITDPKKTFDL